MTERRWKRRPAGANWGEFGDDDQKGRLNWLTERKVLEGMAEVKAGKVFSLSLPLDVPRGGGLNARRQPPRVMAARAGGRPYFGYRADESARSATDVVCDDAFCVHSQYATQWDALSHVGGVFDADDDGRAEVVFYNGYRLGEHVLVPKEGDSVGGAHALGIEVMAQTGVQGRGVLNELRDHYGDARRKVGYEALMRVLDADRVEVERGDMVCVHTGFAERLLGEEAGALTGGCVLDGEDERLLRWVDESGLSVLAADNHAVEERPGVLKGRERPGALMPLHELCLFKLGIHLGELWRLTPLAQWLREKGRSRFLLTAPPLHIRGLVGSPVNPVATV
ncbi:cyclase family protein [Burkholderia pseudomallei]|uniref:cyclase family protein n=1 Tax=Burkholderia pseudomallei TaxID=28450 RepID=UPI000975B3DA|nr:cyclase family protein [Burkholderia pseudomallei]OMX75101.1 cyclase [Burkholderia pseudomallei]